jgi:uncharacterized membrane protein (UPF0127 family)
MKINKKYMVLVIAVIMVIIAVYLLFYYQFEEEGKSRAEVSFRVSDDTSFTVTCEIADTDSERAKGLMDRDNLPEDEGMIFIYETPQNVSFWMKNTLIPLDIIFIHENGTVLEVAKAHVQPDVPDSELVRYKSPSPVKWVVEINQGLSAQHGISAGTPVTIENMD